jgi:hypothetical protein
MMRSPSRRQITARPSRFAQAETMPGVGSQPNKRSSSVEVKVFLAVREEGGNMGLLMGRDQSSPYILIERFY